MLRHDRKRVKNRKCHGGDVDFTERSLSRALSAARRADIRAHVCVCVCELVIEINRRPQSEMV